jgi:hypothetical protein
MNPHTPKWTPMLGIRVPNGLPNFQSVIVRVKTHLLGKKFNIIGKILKRRCLKWARIAHLDIWNTSYGHKKGRKSNCQFDSQPLKIKNWPDFLACKWRVTYRWKILNKGYNFALDLIAIEGLHRKLCTPIVAGISTVGISRLPLGSPEIKSHLDVAPVKRRKVYYKGEGDGFPQIRAVVSLVCSSCPWLILAPKVLKLCTNQLVVWFVQIRVSDWSLSILLSPIPEL